MDLSSGVCDRSREGNMTSHEPILVGEASDLSLFQPPEKGDLEDETNLRCKG